MTCTTCDGSSTALSTLTAAKIDVVVDHDVDPKANTIEFAVVSLGTTSPEAWICASVCSYTA